MILHSRTAKKTWQMMWRKIIFKWQPSKLLWICIFGAVIKSRTTEKNYYLGRLLWSWGHKLVLLNEKRSYTAASIALVNGCIACICSWLLVIYILDVDRQATVIYRRVTWSANGFAIMKKQHLSSFVAGQGSLVQCVFMCFSTNFQTSFCGFFVCFCSFFFRWNCISSILRNEFKRFASGAVLSFAKKISASFQF